MERIKEIAVQIPNQPGVLAKICKALAEENINIKAIHVPESKRTGVLRIVTDNLESTGNIFNDLGYSYSLEEVFKLKVTNEPGELASIADELGLSNISIDSLYSTTDTEGSKETVIMAVSDTDEAESILTEKFD